MLVIGRALVGRDKWYGEEPWKIGFLRVGSSIGEGCEPPRE